MFLLLHAWRHAVHLSHLSTTIIGSDMCPPMKCYVPRDYDHSLWGSCRTITLVSAHLCAFEVCLCVFEVCVCAKRCVLCEYDILVCMFEHNTQCAARPRTLQTYLSILSITKKRSQYCFLSQVIIISMDEFEDLDGLVTNWPAKHFIKRRVYYYD